MTILSYGENGAYGSTIEWNVGERLTRYSEPMMVRFVDEVRVDGNELEYIRTRFPFILNSRTAKEWSNALRGMAVTNNLKFYGDDAKFIVGNLT